MNICRRPLTIASYLCNRQNITLWMIMTMKMRKQKNYWIVHGFTSLSESVFCISYRGYHLPIFPTLMIIWKLAMSKKFPCQITFHNNKSSSGRNQTRLDGRTKTVRLNRTMYNSGIRVAGDAQRTGGHHSCQEIRIGGMDELYRKIWCSARLCYSDRMDKKRMDELSK